MTENDTSLDYSYQKAEIEKTGNTILKIAQQTKNTAIEGFLSEVLDKLSTEEFYLAILGLFKRGKSTLINALLGQPIIPTGVIPVTSVITRIRHANNLSAKIKFSDGSEKDVPVESLHDYVSEEGNPNNEKGVVIADVFAPAPILKDGIILVDTPGVGSTYLSGTTTTFQFLDRVDFAVFVLAVDPPVGQQEIELLSSLASKSNKILFVLNKIDYVDPTAVNESVRYCQRVIGKQLGAKIDSSLIIYPISAKLALEGRLHNDHRQVDRSGIEKFEATLKETLMAQKENLIIKSAWKKLEKSAADLRTFVEVELNTLEMPLDNLANLLLEFEQYLTQVDQRKRELFYVLEGRVKEIVNMLDEDLTDFKKEQEDVLVKQIQDFAEQRLTSESTSSKSVVNEVDQYLKKTLIEVYSQFIRTEDTQVGSRFQQLVDEANGKMNALIGDVKHKAQQLFGSQTTDSLFSVSLDFETRFYYHLDPIFFDRVTLSTDEIGQFLPKSWFKGILKKKLDERVRDEFDKNGGRIRYDYFVTRINQAVLMLRRDINQALESSTETVKRAVHEAQELKTKNETEVFSSVILLNRMLGELQSAQVQAIRKQVGRDFELYRQKPGHY
jgi:tRNA U34 5-carboxymethylaminomethyl modifying GTPase MnmE/TrmE